MKRIFYLISLSAVLVAPACKTAKTTAGTNKEPKLTGSYNAPRSYYDHARQTVAPAAGVAVATDPEYGVTQQKPVCVGGKDDTGAEINRRI